MMLTQAGETGFIDWDHQPRKEAPRLRNISAFATHTPIFRKRPRSGSRKRQSPNKNMPSGKIGFDHCALCCMKSHSSNANDPSDAAMMKAETFRKALFRVFGSISVVPSPDLGMGVTDLHFF